MILKSLMVFILSLNLFASTDKVNTALQSYEKVHKSFYHYDESKALSHLNEFQANLKKIDDESIQNKLAADNIYKYLGAFQNTKSREVQNNLLNSISKKIFDILVSEKAQSDYSLYYCPMEKKYWLQNTKKVSEVQNPYAPSMPNCGVKK